MARPITISSSTAYLEVWHSTGSLERMAGSLLGVRPARFSSVLPALTYQIIIIQITALKSSQVNGLFINQTEYHTQEIFGGENFGGSCRYRIA